jgi:cytochrome P450
VTSQAVPGQTCPVQHGRLPLYGPEFAADPAATYQALREFGPVAPVELAPDVPANLVVGYDAALDVLRNPNTFPRNPLAWQEKMPADCPVLPMMMYRPNALFADGAAHARYRAVVTDSLGRVDTNALRAQVDATADRLIARFSARGEADLLSEYAQSVPLMMFNHLYGCPQELGERMVAGMRGIFDMVDPEKANAELTQAVLELIALKRQRPGADVPSWMMAHPAKLADEEVLHHLILLMGAGTEPEQNLIANGIRLLLADERFAGDLGGGSMPVEEALDEVLWTDPPMANYSASYPVGDTDFGGVRLPAAEPVVISFAAANNDPVLAGQQRSGNRAHLAWSAGPHSCPAQQQARVMASVAIEKLLDSLPDMRLAVAVDELVWRPGPFHRALTALPVRFTPVAVPVKPDESTGVSPWNGQPAHTPSIRPAEISTPKEPNSPPAGRRRWWSSLAKLWRGR